MSTARPIRVLVVDDSSVARQCLKTHLAAVDGIEVVGAVPDAFTAYKSIFDLHPDVLTLDVEMPGMNGLTFLEKLMRHHPMPVVIHSSVTPVNSAHALSALSLGAIDVVPKATAGSSRQATLTRLAKSVRDAARARPRALREPRASSPPPEPTAPACPTRIQAIGVAASTGGPRAVETILRRIPADFPCILIVQHLPAYFTEPFAARLDGASAARVRVARGNDALCRGEVLIAPGNHHLSVDSGRRARVGAGPQVNFHRPSGDVLFRSMARFLGPTGIGVILTGMGRDGAAGLREMFDAGAHTIAEAESSCAVYGMPQAAVKTGGVTEIAELDQVAHRLVRAVEGVGIHAC